MKLGRAVEVASTVVVAVVAVVMARAWFQDRGSVPGPTTWESAPVVAGWEDAVRDEAGIRVGPDDANVVIIEFIDFQCPFCAQLVPVIDGVLSSWPDDVAVVYHHFPLSTIHPEAIPAAVAAECALAQDRFREMHDALFARQSDMPAGDWMGYARDAGVPDTVSFDACIRQPPDSFPRIRRGRELGERFAITGTPTTWVNGRDVRPTREVVERALEHSR